MNDRQIHDQVTVLRDELACYVTSPGSASAEHVQTLALALIAESLVQIAKRTASANTTADIDAKLAHLQDQIDLLFSVT